MPGAQTQRDLRTRCHRRRGDWNGDGVDTIGAFYPAEGRWNLRDSNVAGSPDITLVYGNPNTSWPVVGDWNGDGVDTIGVYYRAEGRWDLRNSNRGGAPDISVIYGGINVSWPVVGDWNGDGVDTIGVYYPAESRWNLRNSTGRCARHRPLLRPGQRLVAGGR